MEVAGGGAELGVAHRLFDAHDVEAAGDQEAAEGVAQVMPAQRAQAGGIDCAFVAAPQRGAVERGARCVQKILLLRRRGEFGRELVSRGRAAAGV